MSTRLIFVYNANAGLLAGAFDSIHKLVSPATYPCSLCAVTYGALRMDPRWRAYLGRLPYAVDFYHRPDFRAAFPEHAGLALPLVALASESALEVLLSADDLDATTTIDGLIAVLNRALAH